MNKPMPKPATYTAADLARHARLATAAIGKPPAPTKGTCENCGAPTPACIPAANYCAAGVGCRAEGWVDEPPAPITTKDGLLWQNGAVIALPRADAVAREHGFTYAEQLVAHLEKQAPVEAEPDPEPTAAELARDEYEARGDHDFHCQHDLSE
jgi:hypothetical protein